MANTLAATKSNLIALKKSLALATKGFELMDRKKNILMRQTVAMLDEVSALQARIDEAYREAYAALQTANVTLGAVDTFAGCVPVDNGLSLSFRSVMGVELPELTLTEVHRGNVYGYSGSNAFLDEAYARFQEVKRLTVDLAAKESAVFRLAAAIRKTQKRANALKNVLLPRFTEQIRAVSEALDEKEREEFSRMKVIKAQKESGAAASAHE